MSGTELTVVLLYPELLGTYGDGGNGLVLTQRLAWRGLPGRLVSVQAGDPVPDSGDIYVLGGGEDVAQLAAAAELRASSGFRTAVDRGAQVFAVCAGFQLLGEYFAGVDGVKTPGAGLLDAWTRRLPRRAVGEVLAAPAASLGLPVLTGFENHGGGTWLGSSATPLANVVSGQGNGERNDQPRARRTGQRAIPGVEGAMQGNILATYLHGPVLARNPALADLLLSRALGTTLAPIELAPLELPAVSSLRASLGAAG